MIKPNPWFMLALVSFLTLACKDSTRSTTTDETTASKDSSQKFDPGFSLKVLPTGDFHRDEVPTNTGSKKWFGLFRNNEGYYLKLTDPNLSKVHDPVLDGENEATGWRVTVPGPDSCILLIEAVDFLFDRTVPSLTLSKNEVYPNDTLTFDFSGKRYRIFATGAGQDLPDITDYKLYLQGENNQGMSLLVSHSNFDDRMPVLIFAGDIDDDGSVDLIIDTSRHYNVRSPSLFLSRAAEGRELLKMVGTHTSVGG